jgi:2-keto-4-pentenoate hydratase
MALNESELSRIARELSAAERDRQPIAPLSETYPDITVEAAYQIQLINIEARRAQGRHLIGKKIGLTSEGMQKMVGVNEPDYGQLLDDMLFYEGAGVSASRLINPRIEAEIAFVLERDLEGPGVTPSDVIRSTAGVTAALEIIDSRIRDWKIKIQDTVADNASAAGIALGSRLVPLENLDLRYVGFVMIKNGQLAGTGAGAAVLGSPAQAVAWLANKMGEYGIGLKSGEIILSGAAFAAVPVATGDSIHLTVDRLGDVRCYFSE